MMMSWIEMFFSWMILLLLVNNPVKSGLVLLLVSIFMTISWNLSFCSALVGLIYISGLLILLLFMTSLLSNLKVSPSYTWLLLFLILPVFMIQFESFHSFNFTVLLKSNFVFVTLTVLVILVVILMLLSVVLSQKVTLRSV